jgi:hypothetical protein
MAPASAMGPPKPKVPSFRKYADKAARETGCGDGLSVSGGMRTAAYFAEFVLSRAWRNVFASRTASS